MGPVGNFNQILKKIVSLYGKPLRLIDLSFNENGIYEFIQIEQNTQPTIRSGDTDLIRGIDDRLDSSLGLVFSEHTDYLIPKEFTKLENVRKKWVAEIEGNLADYILEIEKEIQLAKEDSPENL